MAVLDRKPHKLFICLPYEGYEDEDGHFHQGGERWQKYMTCDVVPASVSANLITHEDGRTETFEYTIYLTTKTRDFQYGERVRLCRFGELSPIYKVKGFQRYQHQCKMVIGYDGN